MAGDAPKEPAKKVKLPKRVTAPTVLQMEAVECGAASLSIILRHYGLYKSLEELRVECGVSRDGSKANNVLKAARKYGMEAKGFKYGIDQLSTLKMPVIIFWNFNHFLVLEGWSGGKVFLSDPAAGPRSLTHEEFEGSYTGVVLSITPGTEFKKGGEKPSFMACLAPRLKGYEWPVVFIVFTGLFLVVPGLVVPAFTRVFIDEVLVGSKNDWVKPILTGIGVTTVLSMVLTWLQQYYLLRFETKLALTTSLKFFRHILHLPIEFFSQRFGGEIGSRVAINDKVAKVLSEKVATLLMQMVTCVFFGVLMFQYDWVLALIAIGFALINLVAMRVIGRKRTDTSRRLLQERGKLMGTSMGGLQMIETLKATGGEAEFFARWAGYQSKALKAKQQLGMFAQMLGVVPPLLTSATTVGVLVIGGLRVIEGHLTMGMLVAFQTIVASFTRPITDFVNFGGELQELQGDMNRLDDVLRYKEDEMYAKADQPRPAELREVVKLTGRLEIRNLTFGYSPLERPLIDDFSLIVEPGQRVALVGGSGSGKSTVAKLVAGLYKPWSGEILFDGMRREDIPPDLLNNSIGMVDQEIFLFQGTVRDNLTMWDNTIPDSNIMEAMRDAAIADIITARPGAENSPVSEGGSNFSGGQRQRLEIARALVGRPTFLILDEATSALDPSTEKEIDTNLRRRGCSSLTVAHRLSTIRDSDEIIVMNRGRIVQRGTHEGMKNVEGFYKYLMHE